MWFHVFVYLINDRSVGESHLTIKLLGTVLISISELAMATAKCSDFREPAYNACTSVSHQSMWTPGFSGGPADSADQFVSSQHVTTGWIKEKKWWKIHSCLLEDIVVQGKTDTTHGRRPDFPEHQSFETWVNMGLQKKNGNTSKYLTVYVNMFLIKIAKWWYARVLDRLISPVFVAHLTGHICKMELEQLDDIMAISVVS